MKDPERWVGCAAVEMRVGEEEGRGRGRECRKWMIRNLSRIRTPSTDALTSFDER